MRFTPNRPPTAAHPVLSEHTPPRRSRFSCPTGTVCSHAASKPARHPPRNRRGRFIAARPGDILSAYNRARTAVPGVGVAAPMNVRPDESRRRRMEPELSARYIQPRWWPVALAAYVLVGASFAWLLGPVDFFHIEYSLIVNLWLLLPISCAAVSVFYPQPWCVIAGIALADATWLWCYERMVLTNPSAGPLFLFLLPVLAVSCLLQCIASLLTIGLLEGRRIVGRKPTPGRCTVCGYSLASLPEARCPERGTPFPPSESIGPEDADSSR
jgi:hypothetical protein